MLWSSHLNIKKHQVLPYFLILCQSQALPLLEVISEQGSVLFPENLCHEGDQPHKSSFLLLITLECWLLTLNGANGAEANDKNRLKPWALWQCPAALLSHPIPLYLWIRYSGQTRCFYFFFSAQTSYHSLWTTPLDSFLPSILFSLFFFHVVTIGFSLCSQIKYFIVFCHGNTQTCFGSSPYESIWLIELA